MSTRRVRDPRTTSTAPSVSERGIPRERATSLPVPAGRTPRVVALPTTAWAARFTIPSPPTTTRLSTPSSTARRAIARDSSASAPVRHRPRQPARESRSAAASAISLPRPLPELGLVRMVISRATRREYAERPTAPDRPSRKAPHMALHVPTPDGRTLEVLLAGDPDGLPLVFHHGTPHGAVVDTDLDRAGSLRGLGWVTGCCTGSAGSAPRSAATTAPTEPHD